MTNHLDAPDDRPPPPYSLTDPHDRSSNHIAQSNGSTFESASSHDGYRQAYFAPSANFMQQPEPATQYLSSAVQRPLNPDQTFTSIERPASSRIQHGQIEPSQASILPHLQDQSSGLGPRRRRSASSTSSSTESTISSLSSVSSNEAATLDMRSVRQRFGTLSLSVGDPRGSKQSIRQLKHAIKDERRRAKRMTCSTTSLDKNQLRARKREVKGELRALQRSVREQQRSFKQARKTVRRAQKQERKAHRQARHRGQDRRHANAANLASNVNPQMAHLGLPPSMPAGHETRRSVPSVMQPPAYSGLARSPGGLTNARYLGDEKTQLQEGSVPHAEDSYPHSGSSQPNNPGAASTTGPSTSPSQRLPGWAGSIEQLSDNFGRSMLRWGEDVGRRSETLGRHVERWGEHVGRRGEAMGREIERWGEHVEHRTDGIGSSVTPMTRKR